MFVVVELVSSLRFVEYEISMLVCVSVEKRVKEESKLTVESLEQQLGTWAPRNGFWDLKSAPELPFAA